MKLWEAEEEEEEEVEVGLGGAVSGGGGGGDDDGGGWRKEDGEVEGVLGLRMEMVQLRKMPQEKRGRGEGLSLLCCWFRLVIEMAGEGMTVDGLVFGVRRREEEDEEKRRRRWK